MAQKEKNNGKNKININLSSPKIKKWIMRDFAGVLILSALYVGLVGYIAYEQKNKEENIKQTRTDINEQISLIDKDKGKVNSKTSEYETLTANLQNATSAINDKASYRNTIPTLLSEIMYVIPREVQLTLLENPSGKKVIINAQSNKYEQLAYFKALLKSKAVLQPNSIVSSDATKEGTVVKIVIEGELP